MTTRSLTAVKFNGSYKIANYGHFDGYPTGQGIYALKFLLNKFKKDKFLNKLSKIRFAKNIKEEQEAANRQADFDGANILEYIQNNDDYIVINNIKFAEDTISCLWAYVIDFDTNTFEIYSLDRYSNKYSNYNERKEFRCLNLIKQYDLNNLPTVEDFEEKFDF